MKNKLKLYLIISLILSSMIFGCSGMMEVYLSTDAGEAADALTLEDFTFSGTDTATAVTVDFTVPVEGEVAGTTISWVSDNESVITISEDGTASVTQPTDADAEVTLTATITDAEGNTATKNITVTVVAVSQYVEAKIIYAANDTGTAMEVIGTEAGITGAVTILSEADGLPVTTIAANAFEDLSTVTSIALPVSITTIETAAFKNFSGNITFPGGTGSLTAIGEEAFMASGITGFSWPAAVTVLPARVFYNCTSLYFNSVPEGVTEIQSQALAGLTNPAMDDESLTFPSTLTTLGTGAFQGSNQYGGFSFQHSLTVVPDAAFSGCTKLRTVSFLGVLTSIGADAFDNTDLSTGLEFYFSNPPSATVDAFTGVSGAALYVNTGDAANFSGTPPWDAGSGIFISITATL